MTTTPRTPSAPLSLEAQGALHIAAMGNSAMSLAFSTFAHAAGRKIPNMLVFNLTHQAVIIIESAAHYNPAAITPAIIHQAIQDISSYFVALNAKIADARLAIPLAKRGQHDPLNLACAQVRRNLAEMGHDLRKERDFKTSEVLKAAMRAELYARFFPAKDPYTMLQTR